MSVTYRFNVPNVSCISCVGSIEKELNSYEKELNLQKNTNNIKLTPDVDIRKKKLTITVNTHEIAQDEFKKDICRLLEDIGQSCTEATEDSMLDFFYSDWFQGTLGIIVGATFLILSLIVPTLPVMVLLGMGIISIVLTLFLGKQSYYHAATITKTRVLTMDSLFAISTIITMGVSIAAFFVPWLPMMFDASLLIFGFRHLGLAIGASIEDRIDNSKTFTDDLPSSVIVKTNDNQQKKQPLATIKPGDILVINPPDIIPLDGIALNEGIVDDTIVTGRGCGFPRQFAKDEQLLSGMRLVKHSNILFLKVTATSENSNLAAMDKAIRDAHKAGKAPIENASMRVLQYFIPTVIGLAILSSVIIGLFFPLTLAIQCAVTILVSACPCTLGMIVPVAVKIGMKKAATYGINFKSDKELQAAAAIDTVVFDLHGTLTKGMPSVDQLVLVSNTNLAEQDVLHYAYALEQTAEHAMGKAIFNYVKDKKTISDDVIPMAIGNHHHAGISGDMAGKNLIIGSEKMMIDNGICVASYNKSLKPGQSVAYLACNKAIIAYFILTDPLRDDALDTINALKKSGKTIYMCTGADQNTAAHYARMLGISANNIAAGCASNNHITGHNKIDYLKHLRAKNLTVAMIGDASNDAPALAQSDFGIAIDSTSSCRKTQKEAGVIIQDKSLLPIINTFEIAKQTITNIKQNLSFSLGYNVTTMLLTTVLIVAFGFTLNPGIGVALMILQMSLISWNAYRFKTQPLTDYQPVPNQSVPTMASSSYAKCHQIIPQKDVNAHCITSSITTPDLQSPKPAVATITNDACKDYDNTTAFSVLQRP